MKVLRHSDANVLDLKSEAQRPISKAQTEGAKLEWIRLGTATKLFGISRSRLYLLINDRSIKSFSLRGKGGIKGIRLISYDSLRAFLEREAQAAEEAEKGVSRE
jgi:hypothetical protein